MAIEAIVLIAYGDGVYIMQGDLSVAGDGGI
jgi:hypothetical protein